MDLKQMREFITEKTAKNAKKFGDLLPLATENGKYRLSEDTNWVGGFWPGLNFICYELTGDKKFIDQARVSNHRFEKRLYDKPESLDHDIGFLYILPFVADYKVTGNQEAKKVALDAAKLLKSKYNKVGRFIQAWRVWRPGEKFSEDNKGRIIIDCMYNVPLLFWANENTQDTEYLEVAKSHSDTCAASIIRPDFTTYHTFVFDPETGKPRFGQTHQGYADDSCWARGQAWGIGGYAYAYRYTRDERYLDLAKKLTKVFLDSLEDDYVPMWDLSLRFSKSEPRDTSAAAIAVCGILELCKFVTEDVKAYYLENVGKIMESLYNNYSTRSMPEDEGLLIHACGHKPAGRDMDCSLIYGDYYFAEAVARLSGSTEAYW